VTGSTTIRDRRSGTVAQAWAAGEGASCTAALWHGGRLLWSHAFAAAADRDAAVERSFAYLRDTAGYGPDKLHLKPQGKP
jgi:hypothetical protein